VKGGFRAQDSTWLGCNGLIGLALVAGMVLAGASLALVTLLRLLVTIESAATAARLTDARDA
jgi:hypothetical protein